MAPSLADTRLAGLPYLSAEELNALAGCAASRRIVSAGSPLAGPAMGDVAVEDVAVEDVAVGDVAVGDVA